MAALALAGFLVVGAAAPAGAAVYVSGTGSGEMLCSSSYQTTVFAPSVSTTGATTTVKWIPRFWTYDTLKQKWLAVEWGIMTSGQMVGTMWDWSERADDMRLAIGHPDNPWRRVDNNQPLRSQEAPAVPGSLTAVQHWLWDSATNKWTTSWARDSFARDITGPLFGTGNANICLHPLWNGGV